jgi:hypothetical protein
MFQSPGMNPCSRQVNPPETSPATAALGTTTNPVEEARTVVMARS